MNERNSKLSLYSIRDLVNNRIMYHYVGTNGMPMNKVYEKRNNPWWVESEELRYKSIDDIENDIIIDELLSQAC